MKDLKKVTRSSRHKKGMQEFFILMLIYSYYNNSNNDYNEFSIPQTVIADYFDCSVVTVKRWFAKLKEIECIKLAERDNAGKTGYYKDADGNKQSYIIPKYKKINCSNGNNIKYLNVYILDEIKLNQYLIDHVDVDVLTYIESYKKEFDNFIKFLHNRKITRLLDNIDLDNPEELAKLSKEDLKVVKRQQLIKEQIEVNRYYLDKKHELDDNFPEFTCRYLEEGCLRLTHEICNTINPDNLDKARDNNYWRKARTRMDLLEKLLNTSSSNIVEYDINGSIYRLTYNLHHEKLLSNNIDIYALIWKNCNFNTPWNITARNDLRNIFKHMLMPIYMRPNSLKYRINQWNYIDKYFANKPTKYSKLSKENKEFYESYKLLADTLHLSIDIMLTKIKDSMYYTLGVNEFMQSRIFIDESNLHILIRYKLMKLGIPSVNVYDGFYLEKSKLSRSEFNNIYNECIKELKLHKNN